MPVTSERILAAAFNLKIDACGARDGLVHTNVDLASHCVAWLVEWVVALHLQVSVLLLGVLVLEKLHFLI